jgi:hypothetical protein
MLRYMHQSGEE